MLVIILVVLEDLEYCGLVPSMPVSLEFFMVPCQYNTVEDQATKCREAKNE
jgi:hypothetical protein